MALHWKILIGMGLGLFFGFGMTFVPNGVELVNDWVQPFGTIFVRLLKLSYTAHTSIFNQGYF